MRLVIREAKSGPQSDAEVLAYIEASGSAAALSYEEQLRAES